MYMSEKTGQTVIVVSDRQDTAPESAGKQGVTVLARVALAAVVVVALIISVSNVMRYNEQKARKAELEAQVAACNEEIEELQYLINAPVDKDYVERVARERLGLHYPDEDIYYSNIHK